MLRRIWIVILLCVLGLGLLFSPACSGDEENGAGATVPRDVTITIPAGI